MRVIAYTKYDREAASTRQRILAYRPALADAGIALDHRPLLTDDYVRSLATGAAYSRSVILANYARRVVELLSVKPPCDLLWIYAELFPYLPAVFERRVFRARIPVVYDWDDAFFVRYAQHSSRGVRRLLAGKFERVLSEAAAVTCGNAMLRDYCARFCPNSIVVPTVVDTGIYRPARRAS